MPKLRLVLLFIFIPAFIFGGVSQRHAIACELIEYSDYSEIISNVFASSLIDEENHERLVSLINSGKSRVNSTFGVTISEPTIIITSTSEEASKFGSNAYATAHLTPLGQCLVFGPKGHNVDVIAHEYTHSEVHSRVGWFNHYLDIPIWFNEGVALLVDYREPYLIANIELSQERVYAVKSKGTDFFSDENTIENYQAARVAVEALDKSNLYDGLEKIKEGEKFEDAFAL